MLTRIAVARLSLKSKFKNGRFLKETLAELNFLSPGSRVPGRKELHTAALCGRRRRGRPTNFHLNQQHNNNKENNNKKKRGKLSRNLEREKETKH
ncbi:hypothetical protein EYF80_048213 [Liparis tanakae]|uniref:Uncharacterized protein n=1 Tax=Liparis tanakae TaxID=230148 RepID=A0A4Z2FL49_9TELE|nr:hypothetical protein EYF80_048213 [Liparis tanakae]